MIPLLAQNMPGMEWIPLMCIAFFTGHLVGLAALSLRIFGKDAHSGMLTGKVAVGIGLGSVVLFLVLERTEMDPVGYLILATPILPGLLVRCIPSTKNARSKLRIAFVAVFMAVIGGAIFYYLDTSLPSGVSAEQPAEGGWGTDAVVSNPFGLPAAVDDEGERFLKAFHRPPEVSGSISVDLPVLNDFAGSNRDLLLRHLETSAKWFVTKDLIDGQEKLIATRRFVQGGVWLNQSNGFLAEDGAELRIVLGLDGSAYASAFSSATFANPIDRAVQLNVVPTQSGSPYNDSYLVVKSSGAALEVFEQSERKDRPFTPAALAALNQELTSVLGSSKAKKRGFDPALMPPEFPKCT